LRAKTREKQKHKQKELWVRERESQRECIIYIIIYI
jgi:hypothetical protein